MVKEIPEGHAYGIVDPDYARVYSQIRCTVWMYGYACMMHGSFTRDLDLLIVPWAENAAKTPEELVKQICWRCDLEPNGHPPSKKPHGRVVYTLMFKDSKDPRFIDLGFMPKSAPQPPTALTQDQREGYSKDGGLHPCYD